jgi:hypothetical protein
MQLPNLFFVGRVSRRLDATHGCPRSVPNNLRNVEK